MSDQIPPRFTREYWECLFLPDIAEELLRISHDNPAVRSMICSLAFNHTPRDVLAVMAQTICQLAHHNRQLSNHVLNFTNATAMPHFIPTIPATVKPEGGDHG